MKIEKPNATTGCVAVDMTSWQHCKVVDNWITLKSIIGTAGIRMRGLYTAGPVFTTEGTYNRVDGNYIGLTSFGIRMGPNANSCWIKNNRIQPSVTGGKGIYLGSTGAGEVAVAGFPNQVVIDSNSVEFPGALGVSDLNGVYLEAVCDDIIIQNNRFEGAAIGNAIQAVTGSVAHISGNHYSGITGARIVGLNGDITSTDALDGRRLVAVGKASINAITGAKRGAAHNLTTMRTATGSYTFTFINPLADINYVIMATPLSTSACTIRVVAKSVNSFSVRVESVATTPATVDVLQVDVVVYP